MAPAHPPTPGDIVTPNFLTVEEALANVTFPISKRDMMEQVADATVIFDGRNMDLHDLVRDLNDDFFDDEAELLRALEYKYGMIQEHAELAQTPTGAQTSWQTDAGPGSLAGARDYLEPSE